MPQPSKGNLRVFTVTGEKDKAFWTRIGTAFPLKEKAGYQLKLNALPIDGKLILLEPKDAPQTDAAQDAGEADAPF